MKYLLTAACATIAIAAPAQARDGQAYVGIEGGVLFTPDHDADIFADYTSTQSPLTPVIPTAPPASTLFEDALNLDYKMGLDIDAVVTIAKGGVASGRRANQVPREGQGVNAAPVLAPRHQDAVADVA